MTKSKKRKQTIGLLFFILFGFLASGFSLKMSFTSQAPERNWDEPWYNDCEEVSIMMVDSFYNNKKLTPAVAKNEILRIFAIKEKAYGFSLDENADKIVDIINNFLNWKARIVEKPTVEQIKSEIDNGHPVIMPTDGRKLNNRYYATTEYHVFVVSGYDDNKKTFIVQDAGTYHGHDYQYSYKIVENAMHDYNSEDLSKGRRIAIFTSLEIKKPDELRIEPSPVSSAVISGNIPNNEEIKNNGLPIVSKKNTENGSLVKIIKNYWVRLVDWAKKVYHKL